MIASVPFKFHMKTAADIDRLLPVFQRVLQSADRDGAERETEDKVCLSIDCYNSCICAVLFFVINTVYKISEGSNRFPTVAYVFAAFTPHHTTAVSFSGNEAHERIFYKTLMLPFSFEILTFNVIHFPVHVAKRFAYLS